MGNAALIVIYRLAQPRSHTTSIISKSNQSTHTHSREIAFLFGKGASLIVFTEPPKVLMEAETIHLHSFVSSLCFTSCNKRRLVLFECYAQRGDDLFLMVSARDTLL
jgi:hypothetical protein